jgi:hypothetical protein
MPEKLEYLDCCKDPLLETVKHLHKSSHETESIRRCRHCGQHWYYVLHESRRSDPSFDHIVWCCCLTAAEVALLSGSPHQKCHSLIDQKTGILRDDEGVRKDARRPAIKKG